MPSALKKSDQLKKGDRITSPSGNCWLTLQDDGNLVLYRTITGGADLALWASGTQGSQAQSLSFMQSTGMVVLQDASGNVTWGLPNLVPLPGSPERELRVQDDYNLCIYVLTPGPGEIFEWGTMTNPWFTGTAYLQVNGSYDGKFYLSAPLKPDGQEVYLWDAFGNIFTNKGSGPRTDLTTWLSQRSGTESWVKWLKDGNPFRLMAGAGGTLGGWAWNSPHYSNWLVYKNGGNNIDGTLKGSIYVSSLDVTYN